MYQYQYNVFCVWQCVMIKRRNARKDPCSLVSYGTKNLAVNNYGHAVGCNAQPSHTE